MMKLLQTTLVTVIIVASLSCLPGYSQTARLDWGDQGNGTYKNPVLNADYSDPDVIRVGTRYYMVASDFHFIGMQILESEDMVNWKLVSQIYDHFEGEKWDRNERYAGGSWAPAIRYHDGKFWVYFCTPDEGLFMSTAESAYGPWSELHCVKAVPKWEDPCPFWDDDGKAYLGRSQHGAGPIIVHKMSPDGRQLLDDGVTVYTGPVAEGTKFLKKDGWYYLIIPEGGVEGGWQTVLRSKNIYGPYEKKVVLETGSTDINGPHQGALVDTPDGEWWFFHFQQTQPLGRVVHLQPARWVDGWPLIGVDIDGNGIGEPVRVWTKPDIKAGSHSSPFLPQTSDDFSGAVLSLQWQFNHNPVKSEVSLTERPGWLTIHPMPAQYLVKARNMITQKQMGYAGTVTTLVDISQLADGDRAGLACFGHIFNGIGVARQGGDNWIYVENNGQAENIARIKGKKIWLRAEMDAKANSHQLYYSTDGKNFIPCKEPYGLMFGFWKGARIGLYSYTTAPSSDGKAQFDFFDYTVTR